MYTDFYRLSARPFQLSPNPAFFFGSKGHRRAMAYLTYGLHQGEGFIVITGEVGTGKTTLVDYLGEQLSSGGFCVAKLAGGQVEPGEVLALVADAFGLAVRDSSQAALKGLIEGLLVNRQKARQRPLLIIDEVQHWPLPALEQLRMLANLQRHGRALLQIVLVGPPAFREVIGQPDYEALQERVIASHHLGPLDASEVRAYVEHRLRRVGWRGDPRFDAGAYKIIYDHSGGIPRRINLLCSRLLVLGALQKRHSINAAAVAQVLNELDQENGRGDAVPDQEESLAPAEREEMLAGSGDAEFEDEASWRQEVLRLLRNLGQSYEALAAERQRAEAAQVELERLRAELHRIELERLRIDAETSRRAVEVLSKNANGRIAMLRRFVGH